MRRLLSLGNYKHSIYRQVCMRPRLETTSTNPEIIKRVFNTDYFLYEPYLPWLEHDGFVEDTAINPDLLIRRPDGYFDIYDLKTAALQKLSLTKGQRKRRSVPRPRRRLNDRKQAIAV
jgi:hypothetical protein